MIQIYLEKNDEWIEFYPIDIMDSLDKRSLDDLPNEITGKYISGVVGYNPVWSYITVNKKMLREYFKEELKKNST